jgi:hypothetical protein
MVHVPSNAELERKRLQPIQEVQAYLRQVKMYYESVEEPFIPAAAQELAKSGLNLLKINREEREFSPRDTIILNWTECILEAQVNRVEVPIPVLLSGDYVFENADILNCIIDYVQSVKGLDKPYRYCFRRILPDVYKISNRIKFRNIWDVNCLIWSDQDYQLIERGVFRVSPCKLPTLRINEKSSDIFNIIGFYRRGRKWVTFRDVWTDMERMSEYHYDYGWRDRRRCY